MSKPVENLLYRMRLKPRGRRRPLDEDNRKRQRPCRRQFGIRAGTAGIPAHEQIDVVGAHQGKIALAGERAAIDNHLTIGKRQRALQRIEKAQQVIVLPIGCKRGQMGASDRQHNASAPYAQGGDRAGDVRHTGPVIPLLCAPGCARKRYKGHTGLRRRGHRVGAHPNRKGVRCIHQVGDLLRLKVIRQALDTAKSTDAPGHRLGRRAGGASGKRDGRGDPCRTQRPTQGACFGCPAEYKQVRFHG